MQEDDEEDAQESNENSQAQQAHDEDDGPHVTFNEQELEESKRLIRDEIGSSDDEDDNEAQEQDRSATGGAGQSEEAKLGESGGEEG